MKPYYADNLVTLFHGDCREVLPSLQGIDLVLTDPPYGISVVQSTYRNKKSKPGRSKAHKTYYDESHEWDNAPLADTDLGSLLAVGERHIIWGGNYFSVPPSSGWLVWDKENGDNDFADCELAWTDLPIAVRKFKWRWSGMLQENMNNKEKRFHPTQKPLALMRWCLQLVPDVRLVVDPYAGSATTLVVARELGLKVIGVEISERYCEIAARRLEVAQPALFTAPTKECQEQASCFQ